MEVDLVLELIKHWVTHSLVEINRLPWKQSSQRRPLLISRRKRKLMNDAISEPPTDEG